MTVKEIAKKYKLTINAITNRIYSLDLKQINEDKKENQYSKADVSQIVNYIPKPERNFLERKVKIMVIEFHMQFPELSYFKISKILSTDLNFVKQTIVKWYLDNYYLTIQSKL